MEDFSLAQPFFFFLIFIWSGFVRTALGFGGAALSLPLFLFIVDDPVKIIPIVGIHLLVSVLLSLRTYHKYIDWAYLKKTLPFMLPFKIAGVIGLLSLPTTLLNMGVYVITIGYALSYITQMPWKSQYKSVDLALLASGSYISGTSLIGAPLIIAVFSKHLAPINLRATLFCLWFILVSIKLIAFLITDTPLQLKWAIYTLPFAGLGHILGDRVHQKIIGVDKQYFMRIVGFGLLLICLLGLLRTLIF